MIGVIVVEIVVAAKPAALDDCPDDGHRYPQSQPLHGAVLSLNVGGVNAGNHEPGAHSHYIDDDITEPKNSPNHFVPFAKIRFKSPKISPKTNTALKRRRMCAASKSY